jgi:hypothetical protein
MVTSASGGFSVFPECVTGPGGATASGAGVVGRPQRRRIARGLAVSGWVAVPGLLAVAGGGWSPVVMGALGVAGAVLTASVGGTDAADHGFRPHPGFWGDRYRMDNAIRESARRADSVSFWREGSPSGSSRRRYWAEPASPDAAWKAEEGCPFPVTDRQTSDGTSVVGRGHRILVGSAPIPSPLVSMAISSFDLVSPRDTWDESGGRRRASAEALGGTSCPCRS